MPSIVSIPLGKSIPYIQWEMPCSTPNKCKITMHWVWTKECPNNNAAARIFNTASCDVLCGIQWYETDTLTAGRDFNYNDHHERQYDQLVREVLMKPVQHDIGRREFLFVKYSLAVLDRLRDPSNASPCLSSPQYHCLLFPGCYRECVGSIGDDMSSQRKSL